MTDEEKSRYLSNSKQMLKNYMALQTVLEKMIEKLNENISQFDLEDFIDIKDKQENESWKEFAKRNLEIVMSKVISTKFKISNLEVVESIAVENENMINVNLHCNSK
jgi:hypothetical protein